MKVTTRVLSLLLRKIILIILYRLSMILYIIQYNNGRTELVAFDEEGSLPLTEEMPYSRNQNDSIT